MYDAREFKCLTLRFYKREYKSSPRGGRNTFADGYLILLMNVSWGQISQTTLICFAFKILLTKAIQTEGEAEAGATQPGCPPPSIICSSHKCRMKAVGFHLKRASNWGGEPLQTISIHPDEGGEIIGERMIVSFKTKSILFKERR